MQTHIFLGTKFSKIIFWSDCEYKLMQLNSIQLAHLFEKILVDFGSVYLHHLFPPFCGQMLMYVQHLFSQVIQASCGWVEV